MRQIISLSPYTCNPLHAVLMVFCFPDYSLEKAISFASEGCFDGFAAVGGGSVMDTAKAANLLSCHPEKDLMDFVNPPIGRGDTPTNPLKPLICCEWQ